MRRTALAAMAALLAAAGCSTSAPSPQATVTVTATPTASSPSPQASSSASANARLLVSALASGTSASMLAARSSVAGPVMTHYIRLQALESEAIEASGQQEDVTSVTAIGGGYQLCYPQGQGCQSFTASALTPQATSPA